MDSPKQDPGLRLDAAVLAGAMIEGGDTGPDDFYRDNGKLASKPILHLQRLRSGLPFLLTNTAS